MDKYEIERKLNDKADIWKVNDLEGKFRNHEYEVTKLRTEISSYHAEVSNLRSALSKVIELIVEADNGKIDINSLDSIKNQYSIY